ncbi:3-oxoacyl-ACP synthase [Maribacter polysiphoniae]|uniref:3-oxoacyl-ACP synthase n=1 Tax=Maribacter polysiphoniae TaxID=429344 RepID=A0A316E869_9FLAO|nr:3-oxoacyl-ACP synthase [Maribacter polysiphoniae]MBD1260119.1 3-oxoacyl-ACP synthase [Maribacter polysiphoniae]PWK25579.1 transcription elongation GreA/GreB family factor [Maribacter polysiphoniae]
MSSLDLKKNLYWFCMDFVQERISRIQSQMEEVQEALTSETKSSAGDKHETGRAMLQLEREKLGRQLAEAENMLQVLNKVDISSKKEIASLGSLVKTAGAHYFLAISAGEYKIGTEKYYCISMNTPIGIMLFGKGVGDTLNFNGNELRILEIV